MNFGTVADWVSSALSFLAIIFAYWQIYQQKKQMREQVREYETDRKREKEIEELHNRPFFSIGKKETLNHGLNIVWTDLEYLEKLPGSFEKKYNNGKLWYYQVKEKGYMYEFKNISKNSAISLTLAVTYTESSSKENNIISKDVINLYRGVEQSESINFMTPTMIMNTQRAMWNTNKKISFYFASVDGKWYRQDWTEEKYKKTKNGFASSKLNYQGIRQINATEVPDKSNSGNYSLEIKA